MYEWRAERMQYFDSAEAAYTLGAGSRAALPLSSPKFPLAKRGNRHTPNELDEEEGVRRWEQSVRV